MYMGDAIKRHACSKLTMSVTKMSVDQMLPFLFAEKKFEDICSANVLTFFSIKEILTDLIICMLEDVTKS